MLNFGCTVTPKKGVSLKTAVMFRLNSNGNWCTMYSVLSPGQKGILRYILMSQNVNLNFNILTH